MRWGCRWGIGLARAGDGEYVNVISAGECECLLCLSPSAGFLGDAVLGRSRLLRGRSASYKQLTCVMREEDSWRTSFSSDGFPAADLLLNSPKNFLFASLMVEV